MSVQPSHPNQAAPPVASKDDITGTNPILQYFEKNVDSVKFRIPSQVMSDTYYFNLRPLLQTPNIDEEIESEHAEGEMETDDAEEEEFAELSPKRSKLEHPIVKKRSGKSRKRKPVQKDAEYDFEDPFIDDSEAVNAYVSIFDLMAGRVGEDEFDTMEIPEDSETEGDDKIVSEEVAKKQIQPDEERAKDFFVYQGPLVEQSEKEFEMPKKRKKPASPTKSTLSKKKIIKKDSPKKKGREVSAKEKDIIEGGGDDTFTKEQSTIEQRRTIDKIKSDKPSKGLEREKTIQGRMEHPSNIPSEMDTSPSQNTPRASPDKQKRPPYDTEKVCIWIQCLGDL